MNHHVKQYEEYLIKRDYILATGISLPNIRLHEAKYKKAFYSMNAHLISYIKQINHSNHLVTYWLQHSI